MSNPFQDIVDRLISIETALTDLKRSAVYVPPSDLPEPLNVTQAAKFLGYKKQTVYDKVHTGTLPHHKQGNRIYFFQDELIKWVRAGRQKTSGELEKEAQSTVARDLVTRRGRGGRKKP